jgi:hypothetical protein
LDSGCSQLFGNQYGVGTADSARDNATLHALQFQREHGGMETGPGIERSRDSLLDQPISEISVEFQEADHRRGLVAHTPLPPNIINQGLGREN